MGHTKDSKRHRVPTTKRARLETVGLANEFQPHFFDEIDGRFALKREIVNRLNRLKADSGCDSYQKEILIENAIFLQLQLETMRTNAMSEESGKLDAGSYTQMLNALSGILGKL